MEYIEPKPVEVKPHAKRNKIIIGSVIGAVTLAAISVGAYFLISKVFAEYEAIELYRYSYVYDNDKNLIGSKIQKINRYDNRPSYVRVPRQLGGAPVIEIADEAFSNYKELQVIDLPDTIKVIGEKAFYNCSNLTSLNAPYYLESIGTDAFTGTKWLNDAPTGVVMLGKFLYAYNGKMSKDTIIVASEDSQLKQEYPNADVINLGNFNHVSNGVFSGQERILAVEIPSTFTLVNNDTFSGCSNIEKVILPETVTRLGDNAFAGCNKLRELPDLSHVYWVGDYAFSVCDITGEVNIGEEVHYFGNGVFKDNRHLTKVTLNNNISSLGDEVFSGCTSLSEVILSEDEYNVETSHISYVGVEAFYKTAIEYFKVPFNVTSIGSRAFAECENLTGVELYENETASFLIGRGNPIDYRYGEWKKYDTKDYEMYQGVTSFGESIFKNSRSFKEIVLVDDTKTKVSSNDVVSLPVTLSSVYDSELGLFENSAVKAADLRQNPTEAMSKAFIGLTTISKSMFRNSKQLESIILDDDTTNIIAYAFAGCEKLESISIPNGVNRMDSNVFDGCVSLTNITFVADEEHPHALTSIKEATYKNCESLTSFIVPIAVTDIGASAFEGCEAMESITIVGTKLTSLGNYAFKNCKALTSISIPSSTRTFGEYVFQNCTSLTEFELSKQVKSMPKHLLDGCENIVTLTLNADSVVKVTSADKDENNKLANVSGLTTIRVPASLVNSYQEHEVWGNYTIVAIEA